MGRKESNQTNVCKAVTEKTCQPPLLITYMYVVANTSARYAYSALNNFQICKMKPSLFDQGIRKFVWEGNPDLI